MSTMQGRVLPHRLGALIDGMFAIVMTILVLDIKVPHDLDAFRHVNIQQFLTGCFQDIMVYMIVFIILGYLWYIHHNEAHCIRYTDRNHLWINILMLMFIALVPFSSSLVNKFPEDSVAEAFLACNMLIIGVLNYANWAYATHARHLVAEDASDEFIKSEKRKLLIFPLVALLALAAAFIAPLFASYIFLLAPVTIFFARAKA